MSLPSQNTPGPDHSAQPVTVISKILFFIMYARKAVVAFLAAGGGAALAQGIATLDLTNLTLNNLWTGLGVGLVSAFIVYWTSNKGFTVPAQTGQTGEPAG
jgi:hypothetical protein